MDLRGIYSRYKLIVWTVLFVVVLSNLSSVFIAIKIFNIISNDRERIERKISDFENRLSSEIVAFEKIHSDRKEGIKAEVKSFEKQWQEGVEDWHKQWDRKMARFNEMDRMHEEARSEFERFGIAFKKKMKEDAERGRREIKERWKKMSEEFWEVKETEEEKRSRKAREEYWQEKQKEREAREQKRREEFSKKTKEEIEKLFEDADRYKAKVRAERERQQRKKKGSRK